MTDEAEPEEMLRDLLQSDMIIVNSFWFKSDWPKEAQDAIGLAVVCNDIFMPAADAEDLNFEGLKSAWEMWKQDGERGLTAWCVKQRKQRPWAKGEQALEGAPWSIDELVSGLK